MFRICSHLFTSSDGLYLSMQVMILVSLISTHDPLLMTHSLVETHLEQDVIHSPISQMCSSA